MGTVVSMTRNQRVLVLMSLLSRDVVVTFDDLAQLEQV